LNISINGLPVSKPSVNNDKKPVAILASTDCPLLGPVITLLRNEPISKSKRSPPRPLFTA